MGGRERRRFDFFFHDGAFLRREKGREGGKEGTLEAATRKLPQEARRCGKREEKDGGRERGRAHWKLARTCTMALVKNRPPSTPFMLEIWKKLCRACPFWCGASCKEFTGAVARREAGEREGRAKMCMSAGQVVNPNLLKLEKSMVEMTGMLPVASEYG